MVYCRLLSVDNDIAKYSIGSVISDITGVLEIDANNRTYSIEKEPENRPLYMRHVESMISRAREEIFKGDFPEKLTYEI